MELAAAYWYFDLGQHLSLGMLKQQQARLEALYAGHPLAMIAAHVFLHITDTALSLPGAAVLSLAGGGLFGLGVGVVVILFASTIGATLACGVARYLLRDVVSRRFGDRVGRIDEGMAREGAWYLFSLRLVPVFPFFVVNLLMGLTALPLRTFFWVSQLGMLPTTVVFVNAGRELSRIESLSGILSPGSSRPSPAQGCCRWPRCAPPAGKNRYFGNNVQRHSILGQDALTSAWIVSGGLSGLTRLISGL